MKTIFEYNSKSTEYFSVPEIKIDIPSKYLTDKPKGLPEISESEVVRHFTNLSRKNFGVDTGFYPLGSCTMKYSPKIDESLSLRKEITDTHPLTPLEACQGLLRILADFERILCELSGMDRVSFQPAAGAQGELSGLLMIKKWHKDHNQDQRIDIIVPDSSHGTNPASASMAGFKVREIPSDPEGLVDIEELKKVCNSKTAGLMLTNPNTLGLFENRIKDIAKIIHDAGGLLYYDGANFNALMGICRPRDMDFDIMQFNLHKTFSTPHGGGGPGAAPVAAKDELVNYLPGFLIEKDNERLCFSVPSKSIGSLRTFYGNFNVIVKAWIYCKILGFYGLRKTSEMAVLNARYLFTKLQNFIDIPFKPCLHEFVASAVKQMKKGCRAFDIAKRLIDMGYHPPTVYFPLIVKEALMIEPTETESLQTLDRFIEDFINILKEVEETPELLLSAPHNMPVGRIDEAQAARELIKKAQI